MDSGASDKISVVSELGGTSELQPLKVGQKGPFWHQVRTDKYPGPESEV